jgi:hypothetical protein
MLEALYPGRIDLGLGRAPGGDLRTAQALSGGAYSAAERFPEQVSDLVGLLDGALPAGHPAARLKVQPAGEGSPQVWLLGSSDYSGGLAAQLGLRFAFAHFISTRGSDLVMRAYRAQYRASAREPVPVSCFTRGWPMVLRAVEPVEMPQSTRPGRARSGWRGRSPPPARCGSKGSSPRWRGGSSSDAFGRKANAAADRPPPWPH